MIDECVCIREANLSKNFPMMNDDNWKTKQKKISSNTDNDDDKLLVSLKTNKQKKVYRFYFANWIIFGKRKKINHGSVVKNNDENSPEISSNHFLMIFNQAVVVVVV